MRGQLRGADLFNLFLQKDVDTFRMACDCPPMTLTLRAKYREHSIYKGVRILRRVAGTGTCGGGWMAWHTFTSLASARAWIDSMEAEGTLSDFITIQNLTTTNNK